ncbi:D-2-hydroxyacid dehydrogenase [Acinetobacter soli]|uniref:NAD(P)-dependent oxidoreductase n=1 Tax=Acinetobacter soli TaxID=487316 RepID=UPI001ABC2CB2|nr:NAD(P)-dependent oxidoreductase [Acinetobacter soli]MBO3671009.1 D-2-hydroxyacid dehydrogenase [Acinetobacter soli]
MTTPFKITCAEKYVLIQRAFQFDFPAHYTEYDQLTQHEFEQQVHDQDVIIISDLAVNKTILKNNPNLRLVALCSTGYNHIDLALLHQHGVKVCNIRNYAGDAVAEHAFTMMMILIKNFNLQLDAVKTGLWSQGSSAFYLASPMQELKNKTLVILGKGEIGLSLGQKATAFGMNVIFSERNNALICRPGYVAFNDAIQQADILSLHCELNAQTKHLMNADTLARMKKGSLLINVGRGELVDDVALIDAIKSGHLAGFATDTLDQEPPAIDHPLLQLQQDCSNVLITGHIAWATDEAQQRLFEILQDNINKNMQGIEKNLVLI